MRKRRYPLIGGIDISYIPESKELGIEAETRASIFIGMEISIWEFN